MGIRVRVSFDFGQGLACLLTLFGVQIDSDALGESLFFGFDQCGATTHKGVYDLVLVVGIASDKFETMASREGTAGVFVGFGTTMNHVGSSLTGSFLITKTEIMLVGRALNMGGIRRTKEDNFVPFEGGAIGRWEIYLPSSGLEPVGFVEPLSLEFAIGVHEDGVTGFFGSGEAKFGRFEEEIIILFVIQAGFFHIGNTGDNIL